MDSTAVCNMTQDYTPHFNANTHYSAPQAPPPLTPTEIFERPRNKRKSSYPSGLVNYPESENNANKDYYMDMDDNSIDASTDVDSPPSMVSSASETNNRPTYLGATQDFNCKLSPSQERGPMLSNGYDEKFAGPSEPKYMRNEKFPIISPTEKYPEYTANEKYSRENIEKFSENDRYQMFNELTKAQYENGLKFQEKFDMGYDVKFGDFSPDQQVPARSPGTSDRPIKQEPSTPPPPLTSPAGLKIPYPPLLSDLSPNSFNNLSPNKFPEPLNGFAHDQPLDFSTKLKDEFYTTTQAPPQEPSPDQRKMDNSRTENQDGSPNYTCKHCHRPFKSQVNLDRHVEKSHNPKSSKIFSCLLCPYTTRFYSNMYVHIRTHTGDKPYWCGACGASFSQGSSLKIHIISKHGGNKKFFILDRKLGKANLLRFWQRREASQLATDNENNFKPDVKKYNGFPNTFPNMMNLSNMNSDAPPPMPGLEKVENSTNGVQNPIMPNHLPMNNIGNLFPNGMNMFSHMNPLGLNLMGQNPLAQNPMLFGNNNLLLQQSLMNGLNLKNSAFFTKTTKFNDERDGKEGTGTSQSSFYDMKDGQKQNGSMSGLMTNGKMSPNKMRYPEFPPVSMPGGLPPFGAMPSLGGSMPLATTLSSSNMAMMPMPPLMTSSSQGNQNPKPASPQSDPASPNSAQPDAPEPTQPEEPVTSRSENSTANTTTPQQTTTANSAIKSELCEKKLRELRRNVVKMLRMMVPDLQMDKNMNQEGEDVDMLLKEVIWSTATEMDGAPEERML